MTRFIRDTAVTRMDDGVYDATIDDGWFVARGPNGGYVAAIIMRALTDTVGDAERAPRSFTVHYAAPADVGPAVVRTRVERRGRSLTSLSARLEQGDRLVAIAVAAFSTTRPGPEFCDLDMPKVPPAETIVPPPYRDLAPPIAYRFESRWAIGQPPWLEAEPQAEAVAGGWIRLEEPQALDAPAVAAITDAWYPPVFSRTRELFFVPTIDLTVHFRTSLPLVDAAPDDFLLGVFRTRAASEGFLEEDGEVWSKDGVLVAQSRQLAAMLPGATLGN
jgi:acyl-CoA thioesterase